MYLTKENKKKLISASLLIAFTAISIIAAKTLANTLILTAYSPGILPYYYFTLGLAVIITSLLTTHHQQKNQQSFSIAFKWIFLGVLLLCAAVLQWGSHGMAFFVAIALIAFTAITFIIAWNYVSDLFDFQELKRFSKVLQSSSTLGAIISGAIVGLITVTFNPIKLLALIFISELTSIFFLRSLGSYLPSPQPVNTRQLGLTKTIINNAIFKFLALLTITTVITSMLVDYNLKLKLIADIDKEKIAHVLNIIYVISTTCILLVQLLFIDYFFRVFGSKKMIIIYPIVIVLMALVTLTHFDFMTMVILFLLNDILTSTTFATSRSLYLNILPSAIKSLGWMKLGGIVNPLGIICASFLIFGLAWLNDKATVSLLLIIVLCVCSFYLGLILINKYRVQLTQSLYLRRFNQDLINVAHVDNQDVEFLLKEALTYPDTDATIFGLQLLGNDKSMTIPNSIIPLITGDNPKIVKEVAKILVNHRTHHHFIEEAKLAFLKSEDEETRWYLALYLIDANLDSLLTWVDELLARKTPASLAIVCLIYLKLGDLSQQGMAYQYLEEMFHSHDLERNKWFLYVLNEIQLRHKERYLIQFIEKDNPSLQILAIQQVGKKPEDQLLDTLIDHLDDPNIIYALIACLLKIEEGVAERTEIKLQKADSYFVKKSCIQILGSLTGHKSERCLMTLLATNTDVYLKTLVAKYVAYRGVKLKISDELSAFLLNAMTMEIELFYHLSACLAYYQNPLIQAEIASRIQFVKQRVIYYATAILGSIDLLNSSYLLLSLHTDKNQRAFALELFDASAINRDISSLLMNLFVEKKKIKAGAELPVEDPWLIQFIQNVEGHSMEAIYTLTKLRKINLFANLAAETLQVLADCCTLKDMAQGEVIFNEGDQGDGLYIIDSGEVTITKRGVIIATLKEQAYFGELALLADIPRFATVTAASDGVLFYIDKQDFDRITDEIPEIMKSINKHVIEYLSINASALAGD